MITLPKILDIPDKLQCLLNPDVFNKYRYFLLEGGRGGAKSHTIGRLLLYLGQKYNLRTVCGREIQKSISESVYSLLSDLIRSFDLTGYDVYSSRIEHKIKDTVINFRGFREQGAFNIQGMEGVDITWIDEAQAITKQTLDVLIPTIRKENAKIFFTMNRHVRDDPVFEAFADRDDCLHIHINYLENKFCTQALKKEAEECRKKSKVDYDHIWLGIPLDKSEDAIYSNTDIDSAKNSFYPPRQGYSQKIAGFDIARFGDDKCAAVILQQAGALHWNMRFIDEWDKRDLNYTTGRILQTVNNERVDRAAIDADGLGSGPLDTLQHGRQMDLFTGFYNTNIKYTENRDYANKRTVNAYKLKDLLLNGHIFFDDPGLIKELLSIRFDYDNYQRKRLVSKKKMRADGIKSPNKADALIMAVSLIGEVKDEQETVYGGIQRESVEGDLFKIGGIR